MDMPTEPEMLPKSRMSESIRAAYEAGKSAERFFDRAGPADRPAGGRRLPADKNGQGPEPDWHH